MSKHPARIQTLVLVCSGKDCKKAGAKDIARGANKALRNAGLGKSSKVLRTKCTGHCKRAPVLCVMPSGDWIADMNVDDSIATLERALAGSTNE